MGESSERLRVARERAGYKSALAAAKHFGWTPSTYASHENGQTPEVPRDAAIKYARAFKVSPSWILTAEGPMEAQNTVRLMGRVGAGAEISPEHEQVPEEGLDEIELPFPIGIEAIAFEVQGESMLPRYDAGALVVCSTAPRDPDSFIGFEVAVRTSKGARYLKTLRRGSKRGLYTLESFNARPIPDVKIAWLGEILAIVPASRRSQVVPLRKRKAG